MKKIISNLNVGGVTEFAILSLALINQALSMSGRGPLPIDSNQLNYWVSTTLTGIIALVSYFDHNTLVKSGSGNNEK